MRATIQPCHNIVIVPGDGRFPQMDLSGWSLVGGASGQSASGTSSSSRSAATRSKRRQSGRVQTGPEAEWKRRSPVALANRMSARWMLEGVATSFVCSAS